jgi:hypothetical protein
MAGVEKLAERLEKLQKRLETVEKTVPLAYELVSLSERLNIPLNLYRDQLRQLVVLNGIREFAPSVEKDEISRLIIQCLLSKAGMNITNVTERVRSMRGKASRRIIAQRLKSLGKIGIVESFPGANNEKLYRLRSMKSEKS